MTRYTKEELETEEFVIRKVLSGKFKRNHPQFQDPEIGENFIVVFSLNSPKLDVQRFRNRVNQIITKYNYRVKLGRTIYRKGKTPIIPFKRY